MTKRGAKSHTTIAGHTLSWAELTVLNQVQDYLLKNCGDSQWTATTSPKGDGRGVPLREIFSILDPNGGHKRYCVRRLGELGVLRACQIEIENDILKGKPQ